MDELWGSTEVLFCWHGSELPGKTYNANFTCHSVSFRILGSNRYFFSFLVLPSQSRKVPKLTRACLYPANMVAGHRSEYFYARFGRIPPISESRALKTLSNLAIFSVFSKKPKLNSTGRYQNQLGVPVRG